jgi:hypothetical protein
LSDSIENVSFESVEEKISQHICGCARCVVPLMSKEKVENVESIIHEKVRKKEIGKRRWVSLSLELFHDSILRFLS